jgi:hypothetical protein
MSSAQWRIGNGGNGGQYSINDVVSSSRQYLWRKIAIFSRIISKRKNEMLASKIEVSA